MIDIIIIIVFVRVLFIFTNWGPCLLVTIHKFDLCKHSYVIMNDVTFIDCNVQILSSNCLRKQFDVSIMGAYDGAEICELVGLYALSQLN